MLLSKILNSDFLVDFRLITLCESLVVFRPFSCMDGICDTCKSCNIKLATCMACYFTFSDDDDDDIYSS